MTDFLTAAWAIRYPVLVGLLMWTAAALALAPPIGRRLADRTADDEWAAICAALDLDPVEVLAAAYRKAVAS